MNEENNDGSKAVILLQKMKENQEKISKASKVKSLLQKQKTLLKSKQSLTDFKEPVLDLCRRDGKIETYEKATAGKFIFTHSTGEERFIELRPEDQRTRDYADKKVRWYIAHEDYPYANFNNPVLDNETVTRGYEMTKTTDLKYEARIQGLRNKGKMTWVYIIIGIAIAIAIGAFAYNTWIVPSQILKAKAIQPVVAPGVSAILFYIKKKHLNNCCNNI